MIRYILPVHCCCHCYHFCCNHFSWQCLLFTPVRELLSLFMLLSLLSKTALVGGPVAMTIKAFSCVGQPTQLEADCSCARVHISR